MKKVKRVAALTGVIFLVGLYLLTLISAIFIPVISDTLFMASIFSTIAIPIMLYAYILIYRLLKENKNKEKDETNQ